MEVKNICCIGAGYVGGPTMAVIALKCPNINVTVVDVNSRRIEAWNGPLENLPIYEPGLSDVVKEARGRNLFFSNDIKGSIEKSELIFMAVNTPTKTEGEGAGMAADLKYIESCAYDIAKYSKSNKIVVEKSTVPIRTAEKIKEILDQNQKGLHFEILSNPEFLAEGTAVEDMINPDRVLIGGEKTSEGQKAMHSLISIYSNWISKEKIITTNVWTSELSKLASNAMLAQRVSSINSLSALCESTGANINDLSLAMGADKRIGNKFLNASAGFGGSCFQKDILNLVYICKSLKLNEVADYWQKVIDINNYQKKRISILAKDYIKENDKNKLITLLGWSFKKNTNDTRESPSIQIAIELLKDSFKLEIFDPMVKEDQILNDLNQFDSSNFKILDKIENIDEESSCIIISTAWQEFEEIDFNNILKSSYLLIDCNRSIQIKKIKRNNIECFQIGKGFSN